MKSATMKNGKEGEKMKMFNKEKLEKQIETLEYILCLDIDDEAFEDLTDLKNTLLSIYTSMTSDNSI